MMERAYDNIIIVVTFKKLISSRPKTPTLIDLLWFQGTVFLRHNEC